MMLRELLARVDAGGNGDGARAEGSSARNVVRGVANDKDALDGHFDSVHLEHSRAGEAAQLVSVVVIVGIGAEREEVPDAVLRQLQLGAALQVTSQQAEQYVFAPMQRFQERDDSRQE